MTLDLVIRNGSVITGDGTTFHPMADVLVKGDMIAGIATAADDQCAAFDVRGEVDARGCVVMPGVINAHAHGCIHGPSMPSGSVPLRGDEIAYFRNRHLLAGTTTLLNICGLALTDEIDADGTSRHPMEIRLATAHTQSNIQAALAVDGAGLTVRHLTTSIDQMLSKGAVALGEAGGGQTLGGGAQDYRYIPRAIKDATGIEVAPQCARRLKEAVLGRFLDPADGVSDDVLAEELSAYGLEGSIDAARLRDLVARTVMPSVSLALAGFDELAQASARVRYPAIFHNAAPTAKRLIEITEQYPRARIVAGHSNHPSFRADEAVATARALAARGASIDVSTLDCISTQWRNNADNLDALIDASCVDTISTDFAGGHWDGILEALHRIVRKKQMSAPAAIALATGNVARVFPELAGDRGIIAKGKRADLVIADSMNIGRVRDVIIAGRFAVKNGGLVQTQDSSLI